MQKVKLHPALLTLFSVPEDTAASVRDESDFNENFQFDMSTMILVSNLIQSKLGSNQIIAPPIGFVALHKNASEQGRKAGVPLNQIAADELLKFKDTLEANPQIDHCFIPLRMGSGSGHWSLIELTRSINGWNAVCYNSINELGKKEKSAIIEDGYRSILNLISAQAITINNVDYQQLFLQATNPGCGVIMLLNILQRASLIQPTDITSLKITNQYGAVLDKKTEQVIKLTLLKIIQEKLTQVSSESEQMAIHKIAFNSDLDEIGFKTSSLEQTTKPAESNNKIEDTIKDNNSDLYQNKLQEYQNAINTRNKYFKWAVVASIVGILLPVISHIVIWSIYLIKRPAVTEIKMSKEQFIKHKTSKDKYKNGYDFNLEKRAERKNNAATINSHTHSSKIISEGPNGQLSLFFENSKAARNFQSKVKRSTQPVTLRSP